MRKLICIVLCIMAISCACASAEPFSIRNGIKFGMNYDEVAQKEGELEESKMPFLIGQIDNYTAYISSGELAGYYTFFYYFFSNTTKEFTNLAYDYSSCLSNEEAYDEFHSRIDYFQNILSDKYSSISLGTFPEIESDVLGLVKEEYERKKTDGKTKLSVINYLVRYDEYYVLVEHAVLDDIYSDDLQAVYGLSGNPRYGECGEYIIYSRIDDDVANAAISNKSREYQELSDSLANDF